ncbi:MAG: hypothetical protein K2I23_04725, partial [Clostridia bacterium]|nr:hypothetical protein [Clostridia bacterium]
MQRTLLNKKIAVTLCLLLIVCLCVGIAVGIAYDKPMSADALTSTANADKVSGDLMDGNKLNMNVAKSLVYKLFGTYIYDDVKQYIVDHDAGEYARSGGYVVPSNVISSKPEGVVVQLDGKEWMLTSLTLADVGKETGQIVATLYLADDVDSSTYQYFSSDSNNKGNDMYSSSIIRSRLLSHSAFANLVSGNFASKYLVQPKYIEYQKNQQLAGRSTAYWTSPNDALEVTINNGYVYYAPTDTVTVNGVAYTYNEWGNDYIWLPSLGEVGGVGSDISPTIWGLTATQASHSVASSAWFRTGGHSHNGYAYRLSQTGSIISWVTTDLGGIRPALHLNLTYATSVPEPSDFTITYDGESRDMQSAADEVYTQTSSWNVARLWDNLDTSVGKDGVTFTALNGATLSSDGLPKDAGKYNVDFTLANTRWSSGIESDLTRSCVLTIEKKKIGVDLSLDNNIPKAVAKKGAVHSNDTKANGRAPEFAFTYKNKKTLTTYNEYPTGLAGDYTATAKITNNCNYVLDTATVISIDFTISKTKIKQPKISVKEKPYTGQMNVTFTLADYSSNVTISVTEPSGKTKANVNNSTITLKDVGSYVVTISLADSGANTCWDTSTPNDIAPYDIPIKVNPKELSPTIVCDDTDYSWNVGESHTMTITDDRVSGDNLDYYVYYLIDGDNAKYDDINANKQTITGGIEVTIPNDLTIGNYTFVVELSSLTGNDNGNYFIDGTSKSKPFSVVGKGISVNANSIQWQVNHQPIDTVGVFANNKWSFVYSGKEFAFSVDDSNLRDLGVKIDLSKGNGTGFEGDIRQTNAKASCEVKVWICNYDNTISPYSSSFTLKYEINKAKYNLDNVKWNYTDGALTYTGNMQTITLTNLPSGLTVLDNEYDGNKKREAGDYQASVLGFENADTNNYVTPLFEDTQTYDGSFDWTKNWSIKKAELTLEWENRQLQGLNFRVPQVKGANEQY